MLEVRCFDISKLSIRIRHATLNAVLCCVCQQDPKFRKLSTASKVYEEVLSTHPPMLEVLRLAGFRQQEGGEGHLALLHRYSGEVGAVVQYV